MSRPLLNKIIVVAMTMVMVSQMTAGPLPTGNAWTVEGNDGVWNGHDLPIYEISRFELAYIRELPGLPSPQNLSTVAIRLARSGNTYVGPREGVTDETFTLDDLAAAGVASYDSSAVEAVVNTLVDHFARLPQPARVFVAPSPMDIDPATDLDLRPSDRTALLLLITYDGPTYPISRFDLRYSIPDHPALPPLEQVTAEIEIELFRTESGYCTWRPGVEPESVRLADLDGTENRLFSAGALQLVLEAINQRLIDSGLMSVQVRPEEGELDPTGGLADSRQGRTEFRIKIIIGVVSELTTRAVGDRFPPEEAIDNPNHDWIRKQSPIQPHEPGTADRADVLNRGVLDDYLYRLSRHAGRRVDATVTRGREFQGVGLDFIVSENRPLMLYARVDNTGTRKGEKIRSRFGLLQNQFTGSDDILNLEYITTDFDDTFALLGSYEARFGDSQKLRWRGFGMFSQFSATELGFLREEFYGKTWSAGAEISWNVLQHRQLFLDLVAGARYFDIESENNIAGLLGEECFFLPYLGLRLERHTAESNTDAYGIVEWNMPDVTAVDQRQLNVLGRFAPDRDWVVFKWDVSHSFYLEPLMNAEAWRDITTPQSSTLAHEIAVRFRGQYAFDNRLIPQFEQIAGGMYSVRGYPEAIIASDTMLIGTLEYRFHLPQAFGYRHESTTLFGMPFRVRPQYPYGRADWDLVLRAFLDVAHAIDSSPFSFEGEQTLIGAGVGVEFGVRRNLNLRLDWGFALEDIEGEVNEGSGRVHASLTFLF